MMMFMIVLALSTSSPVTTTRPTVAAESAAHDRYRLAPVDLERAQGVYPDLLSAIRAHRPHWLSTRGFATRQAEARVYYNDAWMGGVEVLQNLPTREIVSVEYVPGFRAPPELGAGATSAVIRVYSKR